MSTLDKRTKRGKRKKVSDNDGNLQLYYNNINGLLTKQDSLVDIVNMQKPDLVALCETKLHMNSTFEINGYKC